MTKEPSPLIEKSRPRHSVLDVAPDTIKAFLRQRLRRKGVRAAYLFGSIATRNASPWSDVDLIIVCDTTLPFVERPRDFWDLLDLGLPIDILVYTPEEFRQLWELPSGFWKTVRESHERLL